MNLGATKRVRRPEPGRDGLMATAIDCFARYGYAGTSIDRIARAAGVTKGALYYHFRDKEQLLFAAVKERVSAFEQFVVERTSKLEDPAAALRDVARICARNATSDNHRRFILTLMVEALDTNDALSSEFREMLRRFRSFHRFLIRQGQERGLFRKDVDVAVASELFVSGILGAEIQYYQDPQSIDVVKTLESHVEQFLAWLVVPRATARRVPGGKRDA
jgi:TetR/AcrR family acrAB operon transcriptional repressor